MNELRGKYVNVVLGVEQGKGMDFLRHPVYIVAHFNGRVMESDCTRALPTPDFNTELVWETEKKTIRKVRSTNSPLRVECFCVDDNGRKECIGFTLLSIRSANIIPANRPDVQVPVKWYKLIGVPAQYKKSHPELYLSLTLRDHCINNSVPPAIPNIPDIVEVAEAPDTKIVPVKFIDGGYIQVGNDISNEKFELKITVKIASNLDMLLPKDLVFSPNIDKFYMSFCLFGITINTKAFYRDLHETIILNEHIVVKLQSTFAILKMFFGQFYDVLVYFYHGTSRLASTKINMEKLISPNMDNVEFKEKYKGKLKREEVCVFQNETAIYDIPTHRKPFIQIESQISVEAEKTVKVSEKVIPCDSGETLTSSTSTSKENVRQMDGSGDRNKKGLAPICETDFHVESPKQISEIHKDDTVRGGDSYQQYSLDVILEGLTWRKHTSSKNFVFKFKHPRASTFLSIKAEIENRLNKNILLESIHCKLIYLSTSENIFHLLETWKPVLYIQDENGSQICQEHYFLTENLRKVKESSYAISLYKGKDILLELKIWMCIQNIGLLEIPKINYQLAPHILDEFLALKELKELDEWKKDIKEKFQEELKAKEKEQLDDMIQNWTERKNLLEKKLIVNVKRCKNLSKELHKGNSTLKIQIALQEKEQGLSMESIHEEIRKSAIKYSLSDNHELLAKISNIERENANLKEMLAEQTEETNRIKKYSLSNQQTATLLQEVRCLEEKYMEAQKVKKYFKDQYAKAVKEIHKLKTEGQKSIQNQLQLKKEELSQLSLDKFFERQKVDAYDLSDDVSVAEMFKNDKNFDYSSDYECESVVDAMDYVINK